MIYLPTVTAIQVDEATGAALEAMRRTTAEISFAESKFLPRRKTYEDYNLFVIKHLYECFETSHCLLIQSDGFVWHPEQWEPEFLNYDYIGAVTWNGFVGNGGFSLRSKRFCELTARLFLTEQFYRDAFRCSPNEDQLICSMMGKQLSDMGMKFAPPEIADMFSWELSDRRPKPLRSFGLHGKITIERIKALEAEDGLVY